MVDHVFAGNRSKMLDQTERMRRRVNVVAEEDFRIDHILELHVAAILAAVQVQAEVFLVLVKPAGRNVIVADGRARQG